MDPKVIKAELNLLKKTGAQIRLEKNKIFIKGPEKIKSLKNIRTREFPGIPTDLQAQLMVLMCVKLLVKAQLLKVFLKIDLCTLLSFKDW